VGLIFSSSTFAKEKVYFCAKDGDYWKGVVRISTIPCSKIIITTSYKKWKKITAKQYINGTIEAFGPEDTIIQSLYDDFEKYNLDTNIVTKIVEKEKKKKKSVIAKEEKKRKQALTADPLTYINTSDAGGHAGVIAMCLNKKNLNKVRLSYFNDLLHTKIMEVLKKVNVIMLLINN